MPPDLGLPPFHFLGRETATCNRSLVMIERQLRERDTLVGAASPRRPAMSGGLRPDEQPEGADGPEAAGDDHDRHGQGGALAGRQVRRGRRRRPLPLGVQQGSVASC